MTLYRWLVMVILCSTMPSGALVAQETAAPDAQTQEQTPADDTAEEAKPQAAPLSPEEFAKRVEEMAKGLELTIDGDIDAEIAPTVGRLTALYYESYPKLLARLDNPDNPAPRHITLHYREGVDVPAYCTGNEITISIDWIRAHPEDIALLTHELTHAVQQYRRRVPGWFTEGLADYTRKIYGPAEQPGWALPSRFSPRDNYTDAYRTTGKFLMWIDETYPGAVDKLHREAQTGEFEVENFQLHTGKTVEELWDDCGKALREATEQG